MWIASVATRPTARIPSVLASGSTCTNFGELGRPLLPLDSFASTHRDRRRSLRRELRPTLVYPFFYPYQFSSRIPPSASASAKLSASSNRAAGSSIRILSSFQNRQCGSHNRIHPPRQSGTTCDAISPHEHRGRYTREPGSFMGAPSIVPAVRRYSTIEARSLR